MDSEMRKLPVRLTRDEYDAKSTELATTLQEIEDAENDLKSINEQMKKKIKELTEKSKLLRNIVRTRVEDRDVECVELRDEDRMVMHIVRLDTQEIVQTRPMTGSERQLAMFPDCKLRVVEDPDAGTDTEQQNAEVENVVGGEPIEIPPSKEEEPGTNE